MHLFLDYLCQFYMNCEPQEGPRQLGVNVASTAQSCCPGFLTYLMCSAVYHEQLLVHLLLTS